MALLFALLAPWGANTMDGGLILAQSYRILHGQVPHLDFLTPRPAGSAYLHVLDFVLPMPLVLASRLIATAEFAASALFFGLLVYRRRLAELGPAEVSGILAATLVSIQTFLLIPFYTIDALVLLGAGWLLVERGARAGSRRALLGGFLLLGVATTTKQSFWFAPIFGLMGLSWAWRSRGFRDVVASLVPPLVAAVAPGAVYAFWVTANGGAHDMVSQVFGAQGVTGSALFQAFSVEAGTTISLLVGIGCLALAVEVPRLRVAGDLGDLLIRMAATALVGWTVFRDRFSDEQWSRQLFFAVVLVAIVRMSVRRRFDVPGLVLIATAWMVTLSWGAPTPALFAGPLSLYVLDHFWRGFDSRRLRIPPLVATAAAAAVVLIASGVVFGSARIEHRKDGQSVALGSLAPALRGIHASESTATLFRDAHVCADRYPAAHVAVIGEGALLSPTLGFHSPFPIDWFWHDDYRGHEQWILDKTSAFDARGHYLVLFQTAPQGLEQEAHPGTIGAFFSDPAMAANIAERLHGRTIPCRSLVAVYRPGA